MTRRERLEGKIERRQEWAGKASERSANALGSARSMASAIPFGQPILVGHHSEKRDRAYRNRIDSKMSAGFEDRKLAEHHEAKAAGLERQLERTIFSDDENAIEALEAKAAKCDASAAQCNAINKAWRKGGREQVAAEFGEALAAASARMCAQFSWLQRKGPMDASHDRAEARRCRERIKSIKNQQGKAAEAEANGGVKVTRFDSGNCMVTFAEKPEREILNALRGAGFRWASGSWYGRAEALPAELNAVAAPQG